MSFKTKKNISTYIHSVNGSQGTDPKLSATSTGGILVAAQSAPGVGEVCHRLDGLEHLVQWVARGGIGFRSPMPQSSSRPFSEAFYWRG